MLGLALANLNPLSANPTKWSTHSNKLLGLALKELNVLVSPITSDNIHQRMNFQYDSIHQRMNFQYEQLLSNITNYIKLMTNFLLILVLYILRNHQIIRSCCFNEQAKIQKIA